jgi:hypothetical protein
MRSTTKFFAAYIILPWSFAKIANICRIAHRKTNTHEKETAKLMPLEKR